MSWRVNREALRAAQGVEKLEGFERRLPFNRRSKGGVSLIISAHQASGPRRPPSASPTASCTGRQLLLSTTLEPCGDYNRLSTGKSGVLRSSPALPGFSADSANTRGHGSAHDAQADLPGPLTLRANSTASVRQVASLKRGTRLVAKTTSASLGQGVRRHRRRPYQTDGTRE